MVIDATIAHHEAGHVLAAIERGIPFEYVTLRQKGDSRGRIVWSAEARGSRTRAEIIDHLVMLLAGDFADQQQSGERLTVKAILVQIRAKRGDWFSIDRLLRTLQPPPTARFLCPDEWVPEKPEAITWEIIDRRWGDIEALALALLERETLTADEVREEIARRVVSDSNGGTFLAERTPARALRAAERPNEPPKRGDKR